MKKLLVFDMDGTLLDSMGMWRNFDKFFEKQLVHVDNIDPIELKENSMIHYSIGLIEEKYPHIDKNILAAIAKKHLTEFYSQNNLLKENVIEKLTELKNLGYKLYVATATDLEFATIGLKSNNLIDFFEKVYTADTLKIKKRFVGYFEKLIEDLGVSGSDIVFFDDTVSPINHSNSVGMISVGVYDENEFRQEEMKNISDYFIYDFSEISENIFKSK